MLNLIDDEVYFQISDSILNKNFAAAFEVTKQVFDKGWNFIDFTNGLIEHFRNILTVVVTGKTELIESAEIYLERYFAYRGKYSESDLLRILGFLNKTLQELRYAVNQRLKIEVSLSHLIGLEKSISIKEALEKLEELKRRLNAPVEIKEPKNTYSAPSFFQPEGKPGKSFEEPKPDIQNYNKDSFSAANYSTQDLTAKWKSFVKSVNQEKLVVGSALSNLRFLGSVGNDLNVSTNDPSIKSILEQNKKYLDGKVNDFFGGQYQINQQESPDGQIDFKNDSGNRVNNANGKVNNELINAIISELGGEELE
jgi:DNA polymerase-3 subunit gamma/tau